MKETKPEDKPKRKKKMSPRTEVSPQALEAQVWASLRFECPFSDCEFGSISYEGLIHSATHLAQPVKCDACGRTIQVNLVCEKQPYYMEEQKLGGKGKMH